MRALVDNDILQKGAAYRLLKQLLETEVTLGEGIGILGSARFSVPKRVTKLRLNVDVGESLRQLDELLAGFVSLEPSATEQLLAADLELIAQKASLNFHEGESQLCAIAIERGTPLLLTGDKTAIEALEHLADTNPRVLTLAGRVRCFEQLVLKLMERMSATALRAAICAQPHVDRWLTISFSCTTDRVAVDSIREGLNSTVNQVHTRAPRILGG